MGCVSFVGFVVVVVAARPEKFIFACEFETEERNITLRENKGNLLLGAHILLHD